MTPFTPSDYLLCNIPALRTFLVYVTGLGYSENTVRKRLGLKDITELQIRAIPIYRKECLALRTPLDIAIDLFLLQGTIQAEELIRLIDKENLDVLIQCRVLSIDGFGAAFANVSLYPVGDRLIFSDHAWPQLFLNDYLSHVPYDQVMYVGTDSRWLARATVRQPVKAALDLCTGSGIHALLAATHAKRTLAVDINLKAVQCTQFNAQVLGMNTVEAVVGDLYENVKDEKFDLITANPPFVPSPENTISYRDGGRSGEDVQRRIVEGLAEHLAPDGMAQIVTELGERDGEPIVDRIRQWLCGAPMDIHVLRLRDNSVSSYSIGHAQGDTPRSFLESVDAWASNLKTHGYNSVISLLLTFQWSDPKYGLPWNRVDMALPPSRNSGKEIEAVFAAERLSRDPDLREKIKRSKLRQTGPVILLDGHLSGSDRFTTCKATLSGQGIPLEHYLNPIERDLLECMHGVVDFSTLQSIACKINVEEETLYEALRSLLRKGLVKLVEP